MPGPIPAAVDRQVGAIPSGDAATRLFDVLANRPAASPLNYGFYFAATDTQVLYQSDGSTWFAIADIGGAGSGAPADATYLVTTANGTLTNEVVVGATPGGELGGTWASPTVDTTHSGTSHQEVDDNAFFYALAFG